MSFVLNAVEIMFDPGAKIKAGIQNFSYGIFNNPSMDWYEKLGLLLLLFAVIVAFSYAIQCMPWQSVLVLYLLLFIFEQMF